MTSPFVWGPRQRAEGGPDPFEDADRPESDAMASAAGSGRAVPEERLTDVLRMLEAKRAEARDVRRVRPRDRDDDL